MENPFDILNQRLDRIEKVLGHLLDDAVLASPQVQQPASKMEELMTRKEVALHFGVSLVTLRKWVKCGVLAQEKVGGKVMFKKSQIIDLNK